MDKDKKEGGTLILGPECCPCRYSVLKTHLGQVPCLMALSWLRTQTSPDAGFSHWRRWADLER